MFYDEINDVIQREPLEFLDEELRGDLASIGIIKGHPFKPDDRMKEILRMLLRLQTQRQEHSPFGHVQTPSNTMVRTVDGLRLLMAAAINGSEMTVKADATKMLARFSSTLPP